MLQINNFEIFSSFRFFFFKKLLNYLSVALYDFISIVSLQLFIVQNKIRLYLFILQNSTRKGLAFVKKVKETGTKNFLKKKLFIKSSKAFKLNSGKIIDLTQAFTKKNLSKGIKVSKKLLNKPIFVAFIQGALPLWKIHQLLSVIHKIKLSVGNSISSKLLKESYQVSNTPLIAKLLFTFNSYLKAQYAKEALNLTFYWEYHHSFLTRVLSLGIFATFKFELFLQKLFNQKLQILYRYEFRWLMKNCWLRKKLAFTYLHSFLLSLLLLDLSIFVSFIVVKLQKTKKIKRYQKALLNTFKRFFTGIVHYEVLDFIGFRFLLRGKLNGKRRKGKYTFKLGFLPNYNLNYRYLYNYQQAVSRFGVFGVKSLLILK